MKDYVPLAIDLIRLDGETQPRAGINEETVADYASVWQASPGAYPFDKPCEVFHDGTEYWCADGFHRILGAHRAKRASINCHVHKGTQRDAFLFAAKCNSNHGLRRTSADKRHVVTKFLKDEEWKEKSNRWIAEVCDVSHTLVADIRTELQPKPETSTGNVASSTTRTGKDGKSRTTTQKPPSKVPSKPTGTNKLADKPGECEVSKGKHEWVSDGNGGRYCEHCKEDHPENVKEPGPAVHLTGIAKTIEACRVNIDKVVRTAGKHALTDDIQSNLDKALIALKKWAKSCSA